MRPGDLVVYIRDPGLYGQMLFVQVTKRNGLLECLVCPDAWHARAEFFGAHEIELAVPSKVAA
jgi:hypothetical protein